MNDKLFYKLLQATKLVAEMGDKVDDMLQLVKLLLTIIIAFSRSCLLLLKLCCCDLRALLVGESLKD